MVSLERNIIQPRLKLQILEIITGCSVTSLPELCMGLLSESSESTDQKLAVTLHDDLGVSFLEAGVTVPITLDTNRADLISVKVADYVSIGGSTKVTILVQAMRQGSALVRIAYKNSTQILDWLLVNVGAYVFPQTSTLHIGNRLSFSILGKCECLTGCSLIEFARMEKLFHLDHATAQDYLKKFSAMDVKHSGLVTYEEFLKALNLPNSAITAQVFHLFDKDGHGSISFREFLAGLAFVSTHTSFASTMEASFKACDVNGNGRHDRL